MKAIILAAGEAKRLRPITENTPKCLLSVGAKTIIDYQIDNLKKIGVNEIIMVTGFMAEKLETYLSRSHPEINWTFIQNPDYQKTHPAYSLWHAKKFLQEPVLYLNADVIFHPDIIREVVESPFESVTAIKKSDWDEEEVNVIIDQNSMKITELGKHITKSQYNNEFIGVTKIGPDFGQELIRVLDLFVEKEEFKKFAADAINLVIQRGQEMYACNISHLPAIEIDTPEDYAEAKKKALAIYN